MTFHFTCHINMKYVVGLFRFVRSKFDLKNSKINILNNVIKDEMLQEEIL